jgi:large subunit ribosomal protein L24
MNRLLKGDQVQVISGKDKGKKGKVLSVFPDLKMVMVDGVNMVKRSTKPNQNFQGGIVEKPALLNWSKVMPLDSDGKLTRVKIKVGKNNQKVRVSAKSGKEFSTSKKGN